MEAFYIALGITLGVVLGILSPAGLVILYSDLSNFIDSLYKSVKVKLEEAKKRPPFDTVEVSPIFGEDNARVKFIKNGEIVWQGKIVDFEGVSDD